MTRSTTVTCARTSLSGRRRGPSCVKDDSGKRCLPLSALQAGLHPLASRSVRQVLDSGACTASALHAPAAMRMASVAKPSSRPSRMPQVVISFSPVLRATASSSMTT
jgi:hypothetical protein